jgi:hypothetical protein
MYLLQYIQVRKKVTAMTTDLTQLTPGQAEQLLRLEDVWPEYGHSLQVTAATGGGMGWRTVKGVEYLTRYTQEDGRKKGRSLGRRGPETEAMLKNFEETTGKARRILKAEREGVALTCRLAKAHGLARLPSRFAETLDWFWYVDINRRLSLFGGTALLAYESEAGVLAPANLVKDDHLQFIARSLDDIGLEEIEETCDVDRVGVKSRREEHRILIKAHGELVCEILLPTFFTRYLERSPAQTLADAFELPPVKGLTVSRDCRPIELTAPDPRTYAMAATCLREEQELWAERADFASTMVRECWSDKFDEDQETVLDQEPDAGGYRTRGPY